ncbi:basic helix-loop-helix domain-containing protein [Crotalus adamanteus]|uniref:Basic helix-loop-helix domain-containing protein n=1 Tax=Crotalus adamanteus TaxID=8729 RepID=A0AAW1C082_CROAD
MTEKAPLKKQHRKKNRETHNAVERHRKKKINAGINRIGELIPCSPALKQSKNMILDQAYKYISEMKKQNDELLLNGGNNEQAEEIKKLRKQLDELQKENGRYIALLKANDICLYDDPTIHWKGNLKNSNSLVGMLTRFLHLFVKPILQPVIDRDILCKITVALKFARLKGIVLQIRDMGTCLNLLFLSSLYLLVEE